MHQPDFRETTKYSRRRGGSGMWRIMAVLLVIALIILIGVALFLIASSTGTTVVK